MKSARIPAKKLLARGPKSLAAGHIANFQTSPKQELKWNGLNLRCQLGLWSSHSNIRGEWVNLEIVASFFALDLSGMERNGILTIGLRPKNFNIYGIDLAQFHEIIRYIDGVIQIAGELDTHDGLEKYFLTISKEDFAAASTNNAQYMGNLLGTGGDIRLS